MRQSAVILARVLGFIELGDLISGSKMSVSELVRKLAEQYSFEKIPTSFEQLDPGKGIHFFEGVSGSIPIKEFIIYDTLLVLETRISTEASKYILEEILLWGAKDLGLNYKANSINRFGYISDVTFFSDAPLLDVPPAIAKIAARATRELTEIWKEPVKYEPLNYSVGHDPTTRKYGIAPFTIIHRAESRFSENKYFSEAPLPTDIHWEMLEEYEKDILASKKA